MRELLEEFAPVYSFAQGEQYFPIAPFFTAFDGVDNGGDPALIDLADPDEVAPITPDSLVLWQLIDNQYRARNEAHNRLERSKRGEAEGTVFVRVRPFAGNHKAKLLRFLRSDEQAWDRLRRREAQPLEALFQHYDFLSLEYYLYYVRDDGLQGHPEDIEFVFLFIPYQQDGDSTRVYPDCFRVITGGGHTWRTPNNVLVLSPSNMPRLRAPNVLVELGGHSSAPDMPPVGRFQPGVDVNWHAYDVWGTRDVQAVLGQGFDGQYEIAMTFPRDSILMSIQRRDRALQAQADMAKQDIEQQQSTVSITHLEYTLVPVPLVELLASEVEADSPSVPRIRERMEALEKYIPNSCQLREVSEKTICFRGFKGMTDTQQSTAVQSMRRWVHNSILEEHFDHHFESYESPRTSQRFGVLQVRTIPREKHRIWNHEVYRRAPTELLKGHLYRPSIRELTGVRSWFRLLTYGFSVHPSEGYQTQIGVIIPAIPVAVRLPGIIEIQAGVYGRRFLREEHTWSLAVLHDHYYSRFFSWYAKLAYVRDRNEIINEGDASDVFISGGPSFLLSLGRSKNWYGTIANSIRLRAGLRIDLGDWNNAFRRVGWEFQLGFRQ
jgi:hypothetical protein